MNRPYLQWMAVLLLSVAVLCGCDVYLPGPSYSDVDIPQEKLREIETLELTEAELNEPVFVEPNEPPAELAVSLEECRAQALQNNLQLQASLMNPTIAAERLSEAEAAFESTFFTNLTTTQTERQPVDVLSQISGTVSQTRSTSAGVDVPLRTGGTVTFDVTDATTSSNSPGTLADPYYNSGANFSISQPLLRGAGRWANMHSIRLAGYSRDATEARTKLEVIGVLAAIDRVYWRLYAARKELEVREQQYELAQAQLEQAQRFVDAGERAQVEIVRAEAGVAQQREAIIVAENNLRQRERELKRVMNRAGLSMQTPTVMIPLTEPDLMRYDLDRGALVETAMGSRMELLELELQLLEQASSIDYAKNQSLPVVALSYTYGVSGAGITRSDSYDLLLDNAFNSQRLGLQARIPLGNKAAESRLRQAVYTRRQTLATRKNREVVIEQEVLNAADTVETNWLRILAAQQNTILQRRLFEAEQRQFELGARTSTDVLDAQTSFANAQSAEISALVEYQISLVDLAYATGTILGAAHVQWEPIVPPAR